MVSSEVFWNVLKRFDYMPSRCVAIPAHDLSNDIAITIMKHYAIDCVFALGVSGFSSSSLSFGLIDYDVSISKGLFGVYSFRCPSIVANGCNVARLVDTEI